MGMEELENNYLRACRGLIGNAASEFSRSGMSSRAPWDEKSSCQKSDAISPG